MPRQISIFDDEPVLASLIQDDLVRNGSDAVVYGSGVDAVAVNLAGQPDLIILDIMLPGKDGLAICREVRATSNLPIILQTAPIKEIDRLLGLKFGADDDIYKPFPPANASPSSRRYLGHRPHHRQPHQEHPRQGQGRQS
jgi:two-component system, OmpR family, response regulator BaeR